VEKCLRIYSRFLSRVLGLIHDGLKRLKLYAASVDDVLAGRVTDVYFVRSKEVLEREGISRQRVVADVHAYGLPPGYGWGMLTGVEEVAALLEGKEVDVYAMKEGEIFRIYEPVMEISGPYDAFGVYESALLGVLRQGSSVSTKAARMRMRCWGKPLIFFGIRCVHPAVSPAIDRAAYIGGCDAVSNVLGAEMIGESPVGTMPHALVILFGDQVKAWLAFDRSIPQDIPRIALCDTFLDEREEALLAAKALGARLHGVRLDTPSSRRGDMKKIVQEVRWLLNINGFSHVKIYVSGGLGEEELEELCGMADGFGVGTVIAFPPSIDLALDIVEVEGRPISKRGKLPSSKQVYRCDLFHDTIVPRRATLESCPRCGGRVDPLLRPLIERGEIVGDLPSAREARSYAMARLESLRALEPIDPEPLLIS
jgi:nicotinate phosphoribosyltransferase